MLEQYKIEDILFLDIETAPIYKNYSDAPKNYQDFWEKKSAYLRSENESAEDFYPRAGIYSEFGKIICISVGVLYLQNEKESLRIKSFADKEEKILLEEFQKLLLELEKSKKPILCAHNGKEFDFPYIARRMLINGIQLPQTLNIAGKKPWETTFIDTLEMWKFGDYKHYTSLALLCHLFNIPTPKDDIDGSDVYRVYWEEDDLPRIIKYCQKDVLSLVQIFRKLRGEDVIQDDAVSYAETGKENVIPQQ